MTTAEQIEIVSAYYAAKSEAAKRRIAKAWPDLYRYWQEELRRIDGDR